MSHAQSSTRSPDGPPPEEIARVDAVNTAAVAAIDAGPRRALWQANEARTAAAAIGYDAGVAAALQTSGLLHRILGERDLARSDAMQALELGQALGDARGRARAMVLLGRLEFSSGNHAGAVEYLFPARELLHEIGDREGEATALYELAYGYVQLEDWEGSLDFARRALQIDRAIGDARAESRELNTAACCLRELHRFDEAIDTALTSLRIAQEGGFRLPESLALSTLCEIYELLGDYDNAVEFCRRTLELGRELEFDTPQLTALIRFGGTYHRAGEFDRAIESYHAALELAERVENRKDVMMCERALSELAEQKGDFRAALVHQRRSSEIREAIFNEAHDRTVRALEARHRTETARKEAEISQLRTVELEHQVAERTRELMRTNERLRESEERYRTLYDDTPSMYFTVDTQGTVLSVNAFGAAQLGYEPGDLLGESVLKVFNDEDRDVAATHLEQCLAEPDTVHHWELRKLHKDGSLLPVRETARLTDREGQPVVLIVCEDITEQRRAEERQARLEAELRQAQKMEAIGRLAGGIAHDFNNLLTAILGFGDCVRAGLGPEHELYSDAAEIMKAAERAAALTAQLLAFSRQQELEPDVFDLGQVVAESAPMLQRLIGEDIEFLIELEQRPIAVRVDLGQIAQVLLNLVVNARDAIPGSGRVSIRTKIENGEAMLAVSDTGAGMDEETKSHIFEPFFTTKERGQGTGLGLSTVYGIVEQSGGRVFVESSPGEGTTVTIMLPRDEALAETDAAAPMLEFDGSGRTVLLVEDEGAVRQLAARVLRRHGYRVIEARNGVEALEACDGEHVDAVVTDVVMPRMSGYELARRLETRMPDAQIVFMSGYTPDAARPEGYLPSERFTLKKPFVPAQLLELVARALATDRSAP